MESNIVLKSKPKKYGLIKKKPLKNIFDVEDDEKPNDIQDKTKKPSEDRNLRKIESEWSKMLEQDPDIFDFDDYYEKKEIEKKEEDTLNIVNKKKESKYIKALLERAQEREKEYDISKEKRNIKKLEDETSIFGETEQFITPGYKRKLEEKKAQEELERKKEEEEKKRTVEGGSDMTSFYKNIISSYSQDGVKKRKRNDNIEDEQNKKSLP